MAGTLPKIVSYLSIVYVTANKKSIIFQKNPCNFLIAFMQRQLAFPTKKYSNPCISTKIAIYLLLVAGLEPARGCPRGILSPLRLPIPPHQRMDGGGFEPPKQFAADLQSVPFGHSGIHPNR